MDKGGFLRRDHTGKPMIHRVSTCCLGAKSILIDFESLQTINGNQQRKWKVINHLHQYKEIQTGAHKLKIINSTSVTICI